MARMRYMNATQAAQELGRNEKTIRRWITEGKLQAERPTPRKLAISESEVLRLKGELERIEHYESQAITAIEPVDSVQRISELIERIEQLEQRVSELVTAQADTTGHMSRIQDTLTTLEQSSRVISGSLREATDANRDDLPITAPTTKEQLQKRATERSSPIKLFNVSDMPEGTLPIAIFAEQHGVKARTFRDHITVGIKGEKVEALERPKPSRPNEKERFLTLEQQAKALDFWTRQKVRFALPESSELEQEKSEL